MQEARTLPPHPLAYKQQAIVSHSSGGWEPGIWAPVGLGSVEGSPRGHRGHLLAVSSLVEGRGMLWVPFIRAHGPLVWAPTLGPSRLPETPPLMPSHWELGFSLRILGAANLQTIADGIWGWGKGDQECHGFNPREWAGRAGSRRGQQTSRSQSVWTPLGGAGREPGAGLCVPTTWKAHKPRFSHCEVPSVSGSEMPPEKALRKAQMSLSWGGERGSPWWQLWSMQGTWARNDSLHLPGPAVLTQGEGPFGGRLLWGPGIRCVLT